MDNNREVLVCAECHRASCWYGEFYCDRSRFANVVVLTVKQLKELNLEDSAYWTKKTFLEIYGNDMPDFKDEKRLSEEEFKSLIQSL